MRQTVLLIVANFIAIYFANPCAADDAPTTFRRDLELTIKQACIRNHMPLDHMRELLAIVQSTCDKAEVRTELPKMSELRRDYLLWALTEDHLNPVLDNYVMEPPSVRKFRIALLQLTENVWGVWHAARPATTKKALDELNGRFNKSTDELVKAMQADLEKIRRQQEASKASSSPSRQAKGARSRRVTIRCDEMFTLTARIHRRCPPCRIGRVGY